MFQSTKPLLTIALATLALATAAAGDASARGRIFPPYRSPGPTSVMQLNPNAPPPGYTLPVYPRKNPDTLPAASLILPNSSPPSYHLPVYPVNPNLPPVGY